MAKRILILFLLAGVLICPYDLSSCGPFLPETVFTTKLAPLDEARFYRGQLDILQPQYRRIYLMAAYRYLTGIGLGKADQRALLAKPAGPDFWIDRDSPAIQGWLQARVQLGVPPLDQIDRFKMLPDRVFILNCGDDAFRNATATLVERGRAGVSHDDLRDWVAAQDQVFANCSGATGPSVPATLPATAARGMQADRAYQIAAAEFYAGQFDAASADFLRIAGDRSSSWHRVAPYLAARALIRKATMVDAAAAPAAQEQLHKVLADPDSGAWHESARGLARYLLVQTDPARAIGELARAVATEKTGAAGAMNDYRILLDQYAGRNKEAPRDADIADWIAVMQHGPADQALGKWRTKRSLPWLVAALTYADQPDSELTAAAAQVPDNSPAFPTVEFHRLRLLPPDEARPLLDAMLSRKMSVSARNLFLAERMRVARDWEELWRFAPRTAAGTYVVGEGEQTATSLALYFDDDAARILDRQAPLATLQAAAVNSSLPSNLQLQVARAVWVRSILLHDTGAANAIVPVLAALDSSLKPYLDTYRAAPDDKARAFAAVWLLLNNPGMRPSIDPGAGRLTPTGKIDTFRDNWWCPAGDYPNNSPDTNRADAPLNAPLMLLYRDASPKAGFLSASQRADAGQERKRLASAPAAPNLLASQAVEWVESHPNDPRAAEALRLAVRAGRYACGGDAQTDHWMKRAFRLLHSRYANTEAARRTPYWYGLGGS
ncbi:MAG: hypothetical protein ABSF64_06630 [Bryobacteraceae bacterium]|jgi:hypothetical protein